VKFGGRGGGERKKPKGIFEDGTLDPFHLLNVVALYEITFFGQI
jgi:hypothetical protein